MSISKIIVGLVTAIPTIYFFLVMSWGFNVTQQMNAYQSGETDQLKVSTPLTWLADRREFREFFSLTELSNRRVVEVQINTSMADLLLQGEDMPEPSLFDLYATARAPQHLIKYCDTVLVDLGTMCDVASFSGKSDDEGNVTLNGRLAYIPAYPLGSPEGIESGDFVSALARLSQSGELPNTEEGRLDVMAQAVEVCGELRALYGNCIIDRVVLSPGSRTYEGSLRATVGFEVYADQTRHRSEHVRAALEQIMDARTALLTGGD